jgi:hypothetical protein
MKVLPYTLEEEVAKEKEAYGRIIDIEGNISILIEYII